MAKEIILKLEVHVKGDTDLDVKDVKELAARMLDKAGVNFLVNSKAIEVKDSSASYVDYG